MGAAEPASFDTVGETIRTNHYQSTHRMSNLIGDQFTRLSMTLRRVSGTRFYMSRTTVG
jgi:hypothetical protein